MKLFYNDDYVRTAYRFDTTKKAELVAKRAIDAGHEICDPENFYEQTEEFIYATHNEEYVNAVKNGAPYSLSESQGFPWDRDTFRTVLAHNAGCVAAVDASARSGKPVGTLSSGLHHARRNNGVGFCTFNGVAIAAAKAVESGFSNVLVLDFDAHCGGGTYSLIDHNKTTHVDVSCNTFDAYDTENAIDILKVVSDKSTYLNTIESVLKYVEGVAMPFDFIIYNAGMDPINSGVHRKDLLLRENMVAETVQRMNLPTIFTLAGGYSYGGYTMEDIADIHMLTVDAFSDN